MDRQYFRSNDYTEVVDIMIPVLYTSNETAFTSYGIGTLTDAVSCVIVQEINGQYELMMQYPITGIHYGSIELRTIIKAKPDRITEAQLFRIYRIFRRYLHLSDLPR